METILKGKKALIVGGGGGIGRGICRKFIEEGAMILITGRTESNLSEACSELGHGARYMLWDIRKAETAHQKILEAAEILGGLDIVVNTAGVLTEHDWNDDPFEITPEDWDYVMDINLRGVFFVCQAAAKYMIEHSIRGHIVNIASEMAFVPNVNAYGPSKWGVRCITEGLGVALGHKGITVNGIAPGPVATSMMHWKEGDPITDPGHPNGRWALPDEIGSLAAFLASPYGENIVGHCVVSDGGHYLAGMKHLIKD